MQTPHFSIRIFWVTLLSVTAVLFAVFQIGDVSADYHADSAHGNSSFGVDRSGTTYAVGDCAHCHDTFDESICGVNDLMLFDPPSDQNFCFDCHDGTGNYQEGGVQNNAISGSTLADDIQQAFGLTTKHDLGTSFTISGENYTLECISCHNVHIITGKYWEADQGKSPVTRFTNNTSVWGASAGQKMSDYAGAGTYQTPAGDTFTEGQLPDYPTFCSDCHNDTNSIFSPSPVRQLHKFDWQEEKHGGYVATDSTSLHEPLASPYQDSQLGSYVLSCTDCHEAHGSTNSYNIRTKVNNAAVTVTGTSVTELCHACHTNINLAHHYIYPSCAPCHPGGGSPQCITCHYHGATPSDSVPPAVSNLSPSSGAGNVPIDSNLTLTISDNPSGIDWSTFQITLSGNKGYSKIYTDEDTSVVSKTGTLASYDVTVNPDADFNEEEVITVTVNVKDRDGNALVPPAWSFVTPAPSDVTPPAMSNLNPANGTTDVASDSNLTFTLSDGNSGIDWDTFSISIAGDKGYLENYTGASPQVSKTGTPASYNVTVDPDDDFGSAEVMTVTVNVNDFAGNALVPPAWSFTTLAPSDVTPPAISNLDPVNGAANVASDSNLTFTLSDDNSGIDWSTFQIILSGNKGYSKIYTDEDTSIVSKTGTPASYNVTVDPDADFGSAEVITVTVNVNDFADNALVPPAWSFTTTGEPSGSLDSSFGSGGIVTTVFGSLNDVARALAIQSDGKLVVAGYAYIGSTIDFAMARYNTDGSLDSTFGTGGIVTTPIGASHDYGYALAIQADGKIVVAGFATFGTADIAVVRYDTDGSLDTSFGGTGKVTTPIGTGDDYGTAIGIQSDGKIVVAGSAYMGTTNNNDFAVVRYNTDGSLDTSFGSGGKVTTPIGTSSDSGNAVAIQADGKIVVAGSVYMGTSTRNDFAVVRYDTDGSLDTSFGSGGKMITQAGSRDDWGYAVAIQSDSKIVVAGCARTLGSFNQDFTLVRYDTDGSLDSSFGSGGIVRTPIGTGDDYGYALAIQPSGKLVVAGYAYNFTTSVNNFAVARYNTDGSFDTSFGSGGKVTTPVGTGTAVARALAIQADGKIVAAGSARPGTTIDDFAVVRYWGDFGEVFNDSGAKVDDELYVISGHTGTENTDSVEEYDPTQNKGSLDEGIYGINNSSAELYVFGGANDSGVKDTVLEYTPDIPNQPPTADAGLDQSVHTGNVATLNGSDSYDPDASYPLTYAWKMISKPEGSEAALTDEDKVNPSFTPDVPGDYIVELIVTDSLGLASNPDEVVVSTYNSPPIAEAGPGQAVIQIGSTVYLDGSQSYDEDGDPISFSWNITTKPEGSSTTLSDPNIVNPTFIADVYGDYVVTLVVNDPWTPSQADSVSVSFDNVKPVADAGVNQSVVRGDTVFLNGNNSYDANPDPLTYSWAMVSKPEGSLADIDDPTCVQTSFMADLPGKYVVGLLVNDGSVDSEPSNVTIVAISFEDATTSTVQETISTVNELNDIVFKNSKMQNELTNKLNAALQMIDQGFYEQALDKLQNDILSNTNGCAETGAPDKNDWIEDCEAQGEVYPLIMEAIDLLTNLI